MSYQYQTTSEITINGIPNCVSGFRDGYDSGTGGAKTLNSMVAHNMSNSLATLCNIGNSCYMNSVLYTLRFAPNFTHNLHHLIEYLELVVQKSIGDHPFSLLRLSHYTSAQHHLAQQHKPKSSSLGRNIPGLHGANCRSWSSKDLASLGSTGSNGAGSIATFSSVTGSGQSVFNGSAINNGLASEPGSNIVCSAGVTTTATNSSIGSDGSNIVNQRENESVVHTVGTKNKRQMVCETLHELFHNLARNEATEIIEPFHAGSLLQAVQCVSATFEGNQQQDAHEFLMCILDSVREACQALNKNLVENPDLLNNSTTSQAIATSAEAMDNSSVAATSLVSSSESKSGSTPFIARNIFRRRKESVKSAKVFSCSRDLAKSQTAVPAFISTAAIDCTANEQTATVGRNQTDALADGGCGLGNQVEGGSQKAHALDGRVEVQDRIRDLGLNFFCEDFEGVTVSRTRCLSCETITEQKETMIDIAIPIMASEVTDAAKNPQQFYQDACITQEYFRGDNKYRCEVCSGYTEACRTISFDVLPRLLVLQLKRFNGDMEKINSYIPTPFVLQCFCRDCLGKQNSERRHVYRLYSVITHVGARLSVGHYIAYTSALDFPLQYVNCARERQRSCVLSATFEGGLQGSASDSLGCNGTPVSKGHVAGGSEKSTSGQLKKLFGGKKACSASDMSKKLKNNVISRFSPNNGVEAVQLNGSAGPQSGNSGSGRNGLSGIGDYYNGGPFCVGDRLDGSMVSGYGGENGTVKTQEHMFSRLACQSGGCCGISLKAATRHQQVSASASVVTGGIGSGNGASSSTTSVTTRSVNCRSASSVASAPNTATSHHTYSLYDSNCGSDSVDEGGTTTLVNCSSFLRSTTSDSSSSNSSATTTSGNTIKTGLSLNDGSFGLSNFSVQQPLLWYMCDDDKIKIMTQPEFEEMLSPNRRHVITPYLLFYARYDVQQKLLQPSPVKSSCKSNSAANAEGSSLLFVPDPVSFTPSESVFADGSKSIT